MKATIAIDNTQYSIDLSDPLDISIPLTASEENPLAWYLDAPRIEPVRSDDWVGKVSEGGPVNFNTIEFNPHAHGTHTECLGHITPEFHSVNDALGRFLFLAEVISITPEQRGEDAVITPEQVSQALDGKKPEALVLRTLPNAENKRSLNHSHTNWPYLEAAAANFIREAGIMHLLIDLPSVDKEKDDGLLAAHKAFWNYPDAPRTNATITEFIYVPDSIADGTYLLNLMIAPFHNDATPSKPILYKSL